MDGIGNGRYLLTKAKHLQGKHNQATHGYRFSSGAPNLARARQLRKQGLYQDYANRARARAGETGLSRADQRRLERGRKASKEIRDSQDRLAKANAEYEKATTKRERLWDEQKALRAEENRLWNELGPDHPKTQAMAEKIEAKTAEARAATELSGKWAGEQMKAEMAYNRTDPKKIKYAMQAGRIEAKQARETMIKKGRAIEARRSRAEAEAKEAEDKWRDLARKNIDLVSPIGDIAYANDQLKKSIPDDTRIAMEGIKQRAQEKLNSADPSIVKPLMAARSRLDVAKEKRDKAVDQSIHAGRDYVKQDSSAKPSVQYENNIADGDKQGWGYGINHFNQLVGDNPLLRDKPIAVKDEPNGRSNAERNGINMSKGASVGTAVHEMGHVLEYADPLILKENLRWRDARQDAAGDRNWVTLSSIRPNSNFGSHETTKPDHFINAYIGKNYGSSASEVLSMGLQAFFNDPVLFAKNDPDMFDQIYAVVRMGSLWK